MSIFKKYGNRMIVALVTIILIIVISMTAGSREKISVVEDKIGNIISPIQKIFMDIGEMISRNVDSIVNFASLKEENIKLKRKISELENNNRNMQNIIYKEETLKNEAILREKSEYIFTKGHVVAKDPGNWFNRFMIDMGKNDGIEKGDIVVQAVEVEGNVVVEGLIGRVIDVGENWAKVITIIDEGNKVSFRVIRTQEGGVISGSFNRKINGYLFNSETDVISGDKLVTSGLGEIFTKGFYIGDVSDVSKEKDDLINKIIVEPAVDFKNIYEVFVITGKRE